MKKDGMRIYTRTCEVKEEKVRVYYIEANANADKKHKEA